MCQNFLKRGVHSEFMSPNIGCIQTHSLWYIREAALWCIREAGNNSSLAGYPHEVHWAHPAGRIGG